MKKVKDGWHKLQGYDVLVHDNVVKSGTKGTGVNYKAVYPYRWNKDYNSWVREDSITVAAFTAGLRRGTIAMF